MRVAIPFNDAFPQYMLEVITPVGVQTVTVVDSHRVVEVALPEGVSEDDVEVLGHPLIRHGVQPPGQTKKSLSVGCIDGNNRWQLC